MQAVEAAGADISSIMTLASEGGVREVVLRVRTINPAPVVWALGARGFTARDDGTAPPVAVVKSGSG